MGKIWLLDIPVKELYTPEMVLTQEVTIQLKNSIRIPVGRICALMKGCFGPLRVLHWWHRSEMGAGIEAER